ncbi:MAG: SDR family NAD(P)-dependent oxidoreductase [Lysinibacillus sp.]
METVVVTGAAGGMGQAIVKTLIDAGFYVAGMDLAEQSPFSHPHFHYEQGNALDEHHVKGFVDKWEEIAGVVNSLGIAQPATPIEEVTLDFWNKVMDVNVKSLFIMTKAVAPKMKQVKKGAIINIASISAVRPRPGLQAYIASKGAAESFSRAMAIELAPFQIRVNTIHPGPADTQMLGQFAAQDADVEQAKQQIFVQSVPLGRLIAPEDIANSVRFLLSDEASAITGATLHVDGGRGL